MEETTSQQEELSFLVSKLESHLNQAEVSVKSNLQIQSTSSDTELDDLFLSPNFDKRLLISKIPILRPQTSLGIADVEATEARCLSQASGRLKTYLESLNDHIVKIVESESDEFLTVASKLDSFKTMLKDLKDSMSDLKTRFQTQKVSTWQVLSYMASQYEELRVMITEKRRLEQLLHLQEVFGMLESQVRLSLESGDQIEIEECARMLAELKVNAKEARDSTFNQQLQLIERQILQKELTKFEELANSDAFKSLLDLNIDEDSLYFLECDFSSIFRVFKLCDQKTLLMDKMQTLLVRPQLSILVKRCYDQKNYANPQTIPLELFTQSVITDILNGSLKLFFRLTSTDHQSSPNSVTGYDLLKDCLWQPLTQIIDQSLSFVFSATSPSLFHRNYRVTKEFIQLLRDFYSSSGPSSDTDYLHTYLESRFNLQTYFNVLQLDITEKYLGDLDRAYDQTNDQLRPIHQLTMQYCKQILGEEVYLAEVGDKLIKLSVQVIIRHINWVMDKVNEKKSIATERILYIIEDMNKLKRGVEEKVMKMIAQRIQESSEGEIDDKDIQKMYVLPLLSDLSLRFEHLTAPCLSSLSSRLSSRLLDNLAAFKTVVPQTSRNRPLTSVPQPSPFLEHLLKPLYFLDDQKMFKDMSIEVRVRIYEAVLQAGYRELAKIVKGVIDEQREINDTLKKYKREEGNELSDFDKMMVQYWVDIQEMNRQAEGLMRGHPEVHARKYDRDIETINQILEQGRLLHDKLRTVKS